MLYLGWQEIDKRRPVEKTLEGGYLAYEKRFGRAPQVVLVHAEDANVQYPGLEIRVSPSSRDTLVVGPKTYYFGDA